MISSLEIIYPKHTELSNESIIKQKSIINYHQLFHRLLTPR
jgi:hypothetical protein